MAPPPARSTHHKNRTSWQKEKGEQKNAKITPKTHYFAKNSA
jgi:hypothetical protein